MAVRIIADDIGAVLYCSTQMEAFGPVFDEPDAAEDFLNWLSPTDARTLSLGDLGDAYDQWHELAYDERFRRLQHDLDRLTSTKTPSGGQHDPHRTRHDPARRADLNRAQRGRSDKRGQQDTRTTRSRPGGRAHRVRRRS